MMSEIFFFRFVEFRASVRFSFFSARPRRVLRFISTDIAPMHKGYNTGGSSKCPMRELTTLSKNIAQIVTGEIASLQMVREMSGKGVYLTVLSLSVGYFCKRNSLHNFKRHQAPQTSATVNCRDLHRVHIPAKITRLLLPLDLQEASIE